MKLDALLLWVTLLSPAAEVRPAGPARLQPGGAEEVEK